MKRGLAKDAWVVRWYRSILRLYPRALRREHGEEMVEVVRRRWLRARYDSPGRRLAFRMRTWLDAVVQCAVAWLERIPGPFPGPVHRQRSRTVHPHVPNGHGAAQIDAKIAGAVVPGEKRRNLMLMSDLVGEVTRAARSLRRSPGFTLVAVLTMALGIGANTAIFSVINGVLLQPLPYDQAGRIVQLQQSAPGLGRDTVPLSIKEVMDYRDQLESLDAVVEYHSMSFTLLSHGEPDRVETGVVSHNFFDLLGIKPLYGRTFTAEDDRLGAEPVLMLSHEYWQQRFGGDPNIVGQVFEMNDKPHTVVGILPPFPQYPRYNDVYMPTVACPFRADGQLRMDEDRDAFRSLSAFCRLAPGATLETATAEVATVSGRFAQEFPDTYPADSGFAARPVSLYRQLTENARPMLLILLGTSGLVLLIACANVANLMLERTVRRKQEMAMRAALGAGRGRLLFELVTEGAILSTAGGLVGLAFASQGVGVLTAFISNFTPRVQQIGIDGWVLGFTLAVSLICGIAFGALPAFTSRTDLVRSLKEGSTQSTAGGGSLRLRGVLIVGQVALSFVLVIGAGLMLNSFWKLSQVNPGFSGENVMVAEAFPNWSKYPDEVSRRRLSGGILERLEAIPGVTAAAVSDNMPLVSYWRGRPQIFEIEGRAYEDPSLRPEVFVRNVSPGYFRAIGARLLAGRPFTMRDHEEAPPVAIVNQSMAETSWGPDIPVGRRVSFDEGETWIEIVGVIADVRQDGVDSAAPDEIYFPSFQSGQFGGFLVVRSDSDPSQVIAQIRDAIHAVDPEQPVENFRTLEEIRRGSIATPRVTAALLGLFGAIALLITVVGIAGVMATSVSQRTQEFGIRIALGASSHSVISMVLRQGLVLVAGGLVIGLAGALVLGRVLAGLLYETEPTDAATFLGVALVFAVAAALACLLPARRATGVDPILALKSD